MRFKIDWAILIVGSKFTVFALFYFVFEGNCPSISPRGAYIWRGDLKEGFLRYWFGELIFGGAYTWRGLFSEFYGRPIALRGDVTSFLRKCKLYDFAFDKRLVGLILNKMILTCDFQTGTIFLK